MEETDRRNDRIRRANRIEALRLANAVPDATDSVVARAAAFAAFLNDDAAPQEADPTNRP